uniref:NAD(P)H dehydrogenase subunit H n=1 Tax=Oryza glumipatula TaxID=40148 RepID=A0A0E0AME6_9ORYZ
MASIRSRLARRQRSGTVGHWGGEETVNWGLSGPMLRASGIQWDLRKVDLYESYNQFDWKIQWQKEGDSLARYLVRIGETRESIKIIQRVVEKIPRGPYENLEVRRFKKAKNSEWNDFEYQFLGKKPSPNFELSKQELYARVEAPKGELGIYLKIGSMPLRRVFHLLLLMPSPRLRTEPEDTTTDFGFGNDTDAGASGGGGSGFSWRRRRASGGRNPVRSGPHATTAVEDAAGERCSCSSSPRRSFAAAKTSSRAPSARDADAAGRRRRRSRGPLCRLLLGCLGFLVACPDNTMVAESTPVRWLPLSASSTARLTWVAAKELDRTARELGAGDRTGETPLGPAMTAPTCPPPVPAVVRCGGDEDETM